MKTDNELIAEFMGLESMQFAYGKVYRFLDGEVYEPHEMEFRDNWSWLMPVVEKIESLGHYVMIGTGDVEIGNDDVPVAVCYEDGDTKIKLVYLAVVEFIKWYNSTLK